MGDGGNYQPLLTGIGFTGFRSIATWQEFFFPTKVTVLAGINNCGKSNVLRFLQAVIPALSRGEGNSAKAPGKVELGDLDRPRGFSGTPAFEVGMPIRLGSLGERHNPREAGDDAPQTLSGYQEGVMALLSEDDVLYWSRFAQKGKDFVIASDRIERAIEAWPRWEDTYENALKALAGGPVNPQNVMERILASIGGFSGLPPIVTISSVRKVETAEDTEADWLSGQGIIRELAAIQNPQHDNWGQARSRWTAINRFVQTVLGDPHASLNIPHDCSTIQVETPQRVLPLTSLGSGVEQVIVLAAAATVTSRTLVCIEEPETNLHPLLQKKLVRYLTDETDNQYVIATHSSHLLDYSRATAYHIRLTENGSVAKVARRPHEMVEICHDLGYRPSDLLQANCVIWVEGPSDRTYIRRWLELLSPELTESIDYSIMFYGGKLLSHISASEGALTKFIGLRQLNQSSAVIIDADMKSAGAQINATKQRIRDEFEANQPALGFAWVTECYTIENYLPGEVLQQAVKRTHPTRSFEPVDQWTNPLPSNSGKVYDKIAIAGVAADLLTEKHLDVLDLRARIQDLRDFIQAANGQSIAPDPI